MCAETAYTVQDDSKCTIASLVCRQTLGLVSGTPIHTVKGGVEETILARYNETYSQTKVLFWSSGVKIQIEYELI